MEVIKELGLEVDPVDYEEIFEELDLNSDG